MASAVVTHRGSSHAPAFHTAPAPHHAGHPAAAPAFNTWVLPRCTMKAEKCKNGMKLVCSCEDEVACGTLQNLCRSLCDGMCSLTCTYNGIPCCEFNLFCGQCKCEYTKDGCSLTCTSGDKACCDMIQACCDCLAHCLAAGCCCYLSFGGTPCCCGCE
ncbi:MAG TPA: hypothetical protein VMF30_09565 [Pirellulales bacterium]|nr:hypothetical protein [Pirellulales bacterium]